MARQMTQYTYNKYVSELEALKEAQPLLMEEQVAAKSQGDLSENSEADAIASKLSLNRNRISELEMILSEAEIVPVGRSPRITIGSTIIIQKVDSKGNPLDEPKTLMYDYEGDPVISGILDSASPLGRLINNGTDGIYTVPIGDGIHYSVKKVL